MGRVVDDPEHRGVQVEVQVEVDVIPPEEPETNRLDVVRIAGQEGPARQISAAGSSCSGFKEIEYMKRSFPIRSFRDWWTLISLEVITGQAPSQVAYIMLMITCRPLIRSS